MTDNNDNEVFDNSSTGDPPETNTSTFQMIEKKKRSKDCKLELKLMIYTHVKCLMEKKQWDCHQAKNLCRRFNVDRKIVYNIVKTVKEDVAAGLRNNIPDLAPKRAGRCGSKIMWTTAMINEALEGQDPHQRSSSRDTAGMVGCSHTTILNRTRGKDRTLRRATLQVRPLLTLVHKTNRIEFVKSKIVEGPALRGCNQVYDPQYLTIHIDEKYFYLYKINRRVYLTMNEKIKKKNISYQNTEICIVLKIIDFLTTKYEVYKIDNICAIIWYCV